MRQGEALLARMLMEMEISQQIGAERNEGCLR